MKNRLIGLLVAGFVAALPAVVPAMAPAKSSVTATAAKARSFPNCTALDRVYPHGVGRPGARDHTSGERVTTFKRGKKLYRLNSRTPHDLDRDNDGIACERL